MLRLLTLMCLFPSLITPAPAAPARVWDLVDVSVLMSLSDQMIDTGDLLPFAVYKQHPVGFINEYGRDSLYKELRVVGLRVDPAENQLRLVWQPVLRDRETGRLTTEDRAAHTFYQLTREEFGRFLTEWAALRDRVRPEPSGLSALFSRKGPALGVHPAFSDPVRGPLLTKGLATLVRKYCGSRNLIQYTAMQLMSPDHTWWSFAGLELDRSTPRPDDWRPVPIPKIKGKSVDFFNLETEISPKTGEVAGMRGQFNFGYDDDSPFTEVLRVYAKPTEADRPVMLKGLRFVARFQNPHLTPTPKLDCASCHAAQPIYNWATTSLKGLRLPREQESEWFANPDPRRFDLSNGTIAARSTRVMRAFGYFGDRPAVNQRVINESALSAHWLNTH